MDDSDDLRSRLDAQVAARRASGAGSEPGRRRATDEPVITGTGADTSPEADPPEAQPAADAAARATEALWRGNPRAVVPRARQARADEVGAVELTDQERRRRAIATALNYAPLPWIADEQGGGDDAGEERSSWLRSLRWPTLRGGRGTSRGRPGVRLARPGRRTAGFLRLLVLIAVLAVVAFGLRTFVVQPFYVPSASMEPTLHGCPACDGDRVLVDKLSYRLHGVHRGDVVVFDRPAGADESTSVLIRRVVGLPGETVSARGGKVYIGKDVLDEPYLNPGCKGTATFGPITVPAGSYFVLGDNRCDSVDSRSFGAVRKASVIGRAFVIAWPLARIHWL
ncbi:MAG TPA: signal peptidase I [Jatrophihabitantaceae bacterium]|jgi:signal peptidase I|nr:signal peptidase I [Jatrophihabitantaceae bacterium]